MLEKCQKTNFKRADVFRILIRKAADFAYCLQLLLLYCYNINEIRERQDILLPTFSGLWLILYCYPAGSPCLSLMCSTMVIRVLEFSGDVILHIMAIWFVEFSSGGYKIRKINILKRNDWILRNGLMGRSKKVPKFDFQSQFSISKVIRSSFIFFLFHWRIPI